VHLHIKRGWVLGLRGRSDRSYEEAVAEQLAKGAEWSF
jgi:hypothetical protein